MRYTTLVLLLSSCCFAIRSDAQVVHFNFDDFATLGGLDATYLRFDEELASALSELESTKVGLSNAEIEIGPLPVNGNVSLGRVGAFLDAAKTIADAFSATDVEGLAENFSYLDYTSDRTTLASARTTISRLTADLSIPPIFPDNDWFVAGVTSPNARQQMRSYQSELINIIERTQTLQDMTSNLHTSWNNWYTSQSSAPFEINQMGRSLNEKIELLGPFGSRVLGGVIASEEDARQFSGELRDVLTSIATLRDDVLPSRISDLVLLVDSIDFATSGDLIGSTWSTYGFSEGPPVADYTVEFIGGHFTHPSTEIEGPFPLGSLHITNSIGNVGVKLDQITFGADRFVDLPGRDDPIVATDTVTMPFYYITTRNIPDDPKASRDYLVIPGLEIAGYINEYESKTYAGIKGQYSSPLRVVGVELPDEEGLLDLVKPLPVDQAFGLAYKVFARSSRCR